VGDNNAGSCGGDGDGVSDGYGLSGGACCGAQDSGFRGVRCLPQNNRKPWSFDVGVTITLAAAILVSAVEGTSAACLRQQR
jgi:hypothetical protein